jgi:hypothetical protein
MTKFQSAEEAADILGRFLTETMDDPTLGPKFALANARILMEYTNPDLRVLLDCTVNPPVAQVNEDITDTSSEFRLRMSADDGHLFWLGNLNVITSLAKKKIKVEGPLTKMLGLLPAIQPAYPRYRQFLTEINREDLL